jgi:Glycosyl transferase 4-like domain
VRGFRQSTFVFVTTNSAYVPGGVEERWLPVMAELLRLGASVQLLCDAHSPVADIARSLGVSVGPYILDRWNLIRSRSRLRKYLIRYQPVAVHTTGLEADLLARWAARILPDVAVIATLTAGPQATRRRRPVDALMRRFDEAGMGRSAAIFVTSEALVAEVRSAGVPAEKIVLDPLEDGDSASPAASVARHLTVYRELIAARGRGV